MSDRDLVAELHRLGVTIFRRDPEYAAAPAVGPELLLAGLAQSTESRLRVAIIPLLLWLPDYATAAVLATRGLAPASRIVLECYYTAAVLLQPRFEPQFKSLRGEGARLPDHFSRSLGIPSDLATDEALDALSRRQAELSGDAINWRGTYEHAARTFAACLHREAA